MRKWTICCSGLQVRLAPALRALMSSADTSFEGLQPTLVVARPNHRCQRRDAVLHAIRSWMARAGAANGPMVLCHCCVAWEGLLRRKTMYMAYTMRPCVMTAAGLHSRSYSAWLLLSGSGAAACCRCRLLLAWYMRPSASATATCTQHSASPPAATAEGPSCSLTPASSGRGGRGGSWELRSEQEAGTFWLVGCWLGWVVRRTVWGDPRSRGCGDRAASRRRRWAMSTHSVGCW